MSDMPGDPIEGAIADLPMLARRKIEAEIIRPIYAALVERLGRAEADKLLSGVIRESAIAQGQAMAASQGGETSLEGFVALQPKWTAHGALETETLHQDAERFDFNVVRCRYAEMYREMGLGHIGHILSCNRDGTFCEGYDTRLKLERSQTIMQGAPHCDFRYRMVE